MEEYHYRVTIMSDQLTVLAEGIIMQHLTPPPLNKQQMEDKNSLQNFISH